MRWDMLAGLGATAPATVTMRGSGTVANPRTGTAAARAAVCQAAPEGQAEATAQGDASAPALAGGSASGLRVMARPCRIMCRCAPGAMCMVEHTPGRCTVPPLTKRCSGRRGGASAVGVLAGAVALRGSAHHGLLHTTAGCMTDMMHTRRDGLAQGSRRATVAPHAAAGTRTPCSLALPGRAHCTAVSALQQPALQSSSTAGAVSSPTGTALLPPRLQTNVRRATIPHVGPGVQKHRQGGRRYRHGRFQRCGPSSPMDGSTPTGWPLVSTASPPRSTASPHASTAPVPRCRLRGHVQPGVQAPALSRHGRRSERAVDAAEGGVCSCSEAAARAASAVSLPACSSADSAPQQCSRPQPPQEHLLVPRPPVPRRLACCHDRCAGVGVNHWWRDTQHGPASRQLTVNLYSHRRLARPSHHTGRF